MSSTTLCWLATTVAAVFAVVGILPSVALVDAGSAAPSQPQLEEIGGDGTGSAHFHGLVGDPEPGATASGQGNDGVLTTKYEPRGPIGASSLLSVDVPSVAAAASWASVGEDPLVISPESFVGDSPDELRTAVSAASGSPSGRGLARPDDDGRIRAVVYMNLTIRAEGQLSGKAARSQRESIDASMEILEETLAGTGSAVITPYDVVPAAVVSLDAAGVEALLGSDAVAAVTVDRAFPAALDGTTDVIDSDRLNAAGVLGNNYEGAPGATGPYEVVILDSGVRASHAAFGVDRVVDGFCYSATGWCPGGATSATGIAAGAHCTYTTGLAADECQHGTHVAGIAAGASFAATGHEGVARGAGIIAGQVGHRSCSSPNFCWRYFFSDLDLGLAQVVALKNAGRTIVAVNMSLGGPLSQVDATCDADYPATQALLATLDSLQVAPVVAAGNQGAVDRVGYPACLSGAYAVSATTDSDDVAGFSNSSVETDWWAPGVAVTAATSTDDDSLGSKSGTSMSAPHVTGSFALLRECIGNSTDEDVAADLTGTGVSVTRNGVTRQRINVLDAATRNVNNNDFADFEVVTGDGPVDDYDWNVCADAQPGEGGSGSPDNSIWWRFTPRTTGTFTIATDDGGGNATTFDTELSVFTGTTLQDLTEIAYDDDGGEGLRSRVVIPLNGGQPYRVRVDGFLGENGELNLHLERTEEPPTCGGVPATIVGTNLSEEIVGNEGDDVIVSLGGHDVVDGGGGNDLLCLGDGEDEGRGGVGFDEIRGESDSDLLRGGGGRDRLVAGGGADTVNGGDGGDVALGGAGGDRLLGKGGTDTLLGQAGDDRMVGGRQRDRCLGGQGTADTASQCEVVKGVP